MKLRHDATLGLGIDRVIFMTTITGGTAEVEFDLAFDGVSLVLGDLAYPKIVSAHR